MGLVKMKFNHSEEHVDKNMMVIQVNIDDMNPEICSYVGDLLFDQGANDVYWIPIIMKKGRPGMMLNVLVSKEFGGVMEEIIFRETTTLGIRYIEASCHRLGRKWMEVETKWGSISIKLGYFKGELVQYAPEFHQCEQIAKDHHIPLKLVYDHARQLFQEQFTDDHGDDDDHN